MKVLATFFGVLRGDCGENASRDSAFDVFFGFLRRDDSACLVATFLYLLFELFFSFEPARRNLRVGIFCGLDTLDPFARVLPTTMLSFFLSAQLGKVLQQKTYLIVLNYRPKFQKYYDAPKSTMTHLKVRYLFHDEPKSTMVFNDAPKNTIKFADEFKSTMNFDDAPKSRN